LATRPVTVFDNLYFVGEMFDAAVRNGRGVRSAHGARGAGAQAALAGLRQMD
jgi:hypothetical protein